MKGTTAMAMAMMWGTAAWGSEIAPAAHQSEGTWSFARRPAVEVEAIAGQKSLSRDEFRRLAVQSEAGVRVTVSRRPDATFGLAADWLEGRSARVGEGFAVTAATRELGLGVRARIEGSRVQAVAGAGVAYLNSDVVTTFTVNTRRVQQHGAGVWYSIGLRMPLSSRVTAGVDLRQTIGVLGAEGRSSRNGAFHVGGTLGVTFGAGARGAR